MKDDFEQTLRHNTTYHGEEGTSGYLLNQAQFEAILAAYRKEVAQAEQAARLDELEGVQEFYDHVGTPDLPWKIGMGPYIAGRLVYLTESKSNDRRTE